MIFIATIKRLESQQETDWFVPTMLSERFRTAAAFLLSHKESQQCRTRRVGGRRCKTSLLQHGSTDATHPKTIQLPVRSFDGPSASSS